VEGRKHLAAGAGLAAAALAGDEPDAAQLEQMSEPDLELLGARGGEEILSAPFSTRTT
jgi:hypothetical protein